MAALAKASGLLVSKYNFARLLFWGCFVLEFVFIAQGSIPPSAVPTKGGPATGIATKPVRLKKSSLTIRREHGFLGFQQNKDCLFLPMAAIQKLASST